MQTRQVLAHFLRRERYSTALDDRLAHRLPVSPGEGHLQRVRSLAADQSASLGPLAGRKRAALAKLAPPRLPLNAHAFLYMTMAYVEHPDARQALSSAIASHA